MSYTKLRLYRNSVVVYYSKDRVVFRYNTDVRLSDYSNHKLNTIKSQLNRGEYPSSLESFRTQITDIQQKVEGVIHNYWIRYKSLPTKTEIQHILKEGEVDDKSLFIEVYNKFIEEKRKAFESNKSIASLKDYVSFRNGVLDFQRYSNTEFRIKDFNRKVLLEYKFFLIEKRESGKGYITKGGLKGSTIKKRYDTLRQFFKWLENSEEYNVNNYKKIKSLLSGKDFSVDRITEKPKRFVLSSEQIKMIEEFEVIDGSPLSKAKDMFMIACKMGLRYSDVISTKRSHIKNENNDIWMYKRKAIKTSSAYEVHIPNSILPLFEKYDYNLKRLSNQKVNQYLKVILKSIKYFNTESTEYFKDEEETIPYKYNELITFHTGRRSFISILLNEKGFSTADILSMTDHKQISTIEKYLNYNEQSKKRLRNLFD